MPDSFQPSLTRQALDELLRLYPYFDLIKVDWQVRASSFDENGGKTPATHTGPWVLVYLGQQSSIFDEIPAWAIWRFAIWKVTGALYRMEGPMVPDDPIWTPGSGTLCLCCGERYDENCPNLNDGTHSMEFGMAVATLLQRQGIDHAEPADVRRAVKLLSDPLP